MRRRLLIASLISIAPAAGYVLYKPFEKPECDDALASECLPRSLTGNPNPSLLTKAPSTIGVIGSGMAGLAIAKELSQ
jgi:hypothetical protein